MSLKNKLAELLETKSAPKGFHFTRDGKLKRGDADIDGPGGPKLRSDPLDKQRSKVPPVSEEISQVDEISSELLGKYKEKARTSADKLLANKQYRKSTNREMGIFRATGKQIEKTTAEIRKALRKEETEGEQIEHVTEAGPFSYGAKPPRKGSVAYNAMMKRKEQEKNKPPIEPKDQMVGAAKVLTKEEVVMNEAVTVKKANYSWGKMVTVHHGAETSYPLHPEHQAVIKKLKPGESTSFTDETNRKVTASREGDMVHLSGRGSNKKTSVAHSHFTEEVMSTFKQFRNTIEEKTLTPAEKKKREEVAKAIERENPNMPMGMKMAIATKTAKRVAEEVEIEEAKALHKMTSDELNAEHQKVQDKINSAPASKTISMNHPWSQRLRAIRLQKMINGKKMSESVELDEAVKTTHEDPLVTVHDKDGLHTHANLSTANKIFNTKVKHTDVHKGPVSVTSGREDKNKLKFAISMHHKKEVMKEEVDDEGKMAKGQLMRMVNQASALAQMMEDDKQLDGWVQSKLTMASDYLDSVHDYLMHNKQDVDEMDEDVHYCAKHVRSTILGDGIVLEAQHADPDEEGNIEWYMVEFTSGIRKVYTEDLEIMIAEYHGNHKKKRMTNGR